MPVRAYFDNLEPSDSEAEIWRFLPYAFFEDLMANDELYFRRSDLFEQDEREGIPSEDFIRRVMGLRRYVIKDEKELIDQTGKLSQFREAFYVNCWHLQRYETVEMWKNFGKNGVAICSRYELLRSAMHSMLDMCHLGLMRYGEERLNRTDRLNVLQFINTKRKPFEEEREVRAILRCPDPFAGGNRHFGADNFPQPRPLVENAPHPWVHEFKRRRVDLKALVTGLVVSPWATREVFELTKQWALVKNHSYEVRRSNLTMC